MQIDYTMRRWTCFFKQAELFIFPSAVYREDWRGAVAAAYLCMRAIDEIEDHPQLSSEAKIKLLRAVSEKLTMPQQNMEYTTIFEPYKSQLADVTLRLGDWVKLIPPSAIPNVSSSTSIMANGMADWVDKKWEIKTEFDLDQYTYYVAGLVGILLSDLWKWYERNCNGSGSGRCLWKGITGRQYYS